MQNEFLSCCFCVEDT